MSTQPDSTWQDRVWQIVFVVSLVVTSWYLMQALHELGHALAALASGGTIQRVVLPPLEFSRTDVSPNPAPGLVVWAGPIVGCLIPLVIWLCTRRTSDVIRNSLQFFVGWCLIANGGYIGIGAANGIGDCGEMLRTGTPLWVMYLFGFAAGTAGLWLWHRLGRPREFWRHPQWISRQSALSMLGVAIGVVGMVVLVDVVV